MSGLQNMMKQLQQGAAGGLGNLMGGFGSKSWEDASGSATTAVNHSYSQRTRRHNRIWITTRVPLTNLLSRYFISNI